MKILIAIVLPWAVFYPLHELPDGRVEVGLDSIIRGDKIEITYSVAMSDGTMVSLEPELKSANDPDEESEDLVRVFGPLALPKIGESIFVTVHGEQLDVKPAGWEVSARHPVRFICKYEVHLEDVTAGDKKVEIKIEDKNYRTFEKQIAVSCRAKGEADLLECDAAPLLVRAERVRLWVDDFDSPEAVQTIEAVVRLPVREKAEAEVEEASQELIEEVEQVEPTQDTGNESDERSGANKKESSANRQIDNSSLVVARILTAVVFALLLGITVYRVWRRVA